MSGKRKDKSGRVLNAGESQRKDGSYQYRYTDNFEKRYYVYAPTLSELREKEQEIQKALEAGVNYAAANITVNELLTMYLAQKRGIRKSTSYNYKVLQRQIEKYTFASRILRDVKVSDVKQLMRDLADNGKAYGTIRNIKAFLKNAFQSAVEDDVLTKNPCCFTLSKVIDNNTKQKKALTKEQQESFLAFVRNDPICQKYYDEIVILLGTGLRISELYGLTKADVDLTNRTIRVERQIVKSAGSPYYLVPPKSRSGSRIVPIISDDTLLALRHVIETRPSPKVEYIVDGHTGFLFLTNRGSPKYGVLMDSTMQRIMQKYNSLHDDQIYVTPHILRHTFCTNMVQAGMNIKALQYIMGHSDFNITMNTYTNFEYSNVEKAIHEMAALA